MKNLGYSDIRYHVLPFAVASGNEAGANSHWIPGGLTDGGTPEAIINKILNNDEYIKISFIN